MPCSCQIRRHVCAYWADVCHTRILGRSFLHCTVKSELLWHLYSDMLTIICDHFGWGTWSLTGNRKQKKSLAWRVLIYLSSDFLWESLWNSISLRNKMVTPLFTHFTKWSLTGSGSYKGVDCTLYMSIIAICFIAQIVASLLLFVEEEDAFWLMCTIVEDLVPTSYYSSTLIGVQVGNRQCLMIKWALHGTSLTYTVQFIMV